MVPADARRRDAFAAAAGSIGAVWCAVSWTGSSSAGTRMNLFGLAALGALTLGAAIGLRGLVGHLVGAGAVDAPDTRVACGAVAAVGAAMVTVVRQGDALTMVVAALAGAVIAAPGFDRARRRIRRSR